MGNGFILEGDLNAKLGPTMIQGDPKPECDNGKRFKAFLKCHNLTFVNSLSLCKGLVTKKRILVNGKVEESIIDYYAVFSRVLPFVKEMKIDNHQTYNITNYAQVEKGGNAIDSDHNTLILKVLLKVCSIKIQRMLLFNIKNKECQITFKNITEDHKAFMNSLQDLQP